MSYQTYHRLPYLSTYAEALERLLNTQPLRKTKANADDPTIYPLGERRDGRKFSIRKVGDTGSNPNPKGDPNSYYKTCPGAQDDDIELLLYRTPVVTFHQDGTLTIMCTYTRWSSSDCYFISETLGRYVRDVVTNRGRLVITTRAGTKIVVPTKESIRLRPNINAPGHTSNTLVPIAPSTLIGHRLNRTKTNEVRARYGEFYRYMKGMIGVRKQLQERKYYDRFTGTQVWDEATYVVPITKDEIIETLPTMTTDQGLRFQTTLNSGKSMDLTKKPPIHTTRYRYDKEAERYTTEDTTEPYELWRAATEEFLELVSTPATNENQHEQFRCAFVWLAVVAYGDLYEPKDMDVEAYSIGKTMDEIIFKYHSEEVIEEVHIEQGKVPPFKYNKWLTRERD